MATTNLSVPRWTRKMVVGLDHDNVFKLIFVEPNGSRAGDRYVIIESDTEDRGEDIRVIKGTYDSTFNTHTFSTTYGHCDDIVVNVTMNNEEYIIDVYKM